MLQQRKIVSIGEYRQIHRVIPPVKNPIVTDMPLGILATVAFIIGFVLAIGQ